MKHPACKGCEFDGGCLTQRLGYEADCPEIQDFEKDRILRTFPNECSESVLDENHFDINPDFEDQ